jgi:ATP-binding protein involved in chromosome partitioning
VQNEQRKKMLEAQDRLIAENISNIKHRIVVFSGKGGVGKTTLAVNLAFGFQLGGNATGILDADVTGPNVPKMLGLARDVRIRDKHIIPQERHGVKVISLASMISPDQPVIWRGPMRSKMLHEFLGNVLWGSLDYLVADLPPGTGDEVMTLAQKMKPDVALIVTTPQELSLIDSRRAINMARQLDIPRICLVENMAGMICPHCGQKIEVFGLGGGQKQAEQMNVHFLGALPMDIKARELADHGEPIILSCRDADISVTLMDIVRKMEEML